MALAPTPEALLQEAQSLERQGQLGDAISTYKQLLTLRADLPDAWFNLAALLRRTGQFPAALACYQYALNRGVSRPEEAHLNRAVIYSDCLHQYPEAERELTQALSLNPTYVPGLLNLANLYEDQGRAGDARAGYERVLELQPENVDALARYCGIKKFDSPADPLIGRLRHLFAAPGVSDADRATLGFSLGRALDSCGAYSEAFQVYSAANRHSRASAPPGTGRYDRAAQVEFIDRLMAAFPALRLGASAGSTTAAAGSTTAAGGPTTASAGSTTASAGSTAASARPTTAAAPAGNSPRPIFICGMFRSGSTLIEQLIASHTNVAAGGELELLPNLVRTRLTPFPESLATLSPGDLQALAAHYLEGLGARFPDAQCVTDKRPDNFLYIGLIKLLFPDAKIVHTRRNPLDNCLSIFFLHLDQQMSYALDLGDIGHYYVQYRRLMQHWKAMYAADIHDVDYDTYVRDPDTEERRLVEFLGLESRPQGSSQAVQAIKTASVWQVREPLYQRSSGRARNYLSELAALRDCLNVPECDTA